ncbi:MAG TPA: hypothetical protein VEV83_05245 [Parafilimonas sp.]|nr:hypothetical protein [Parafilimonas sp.]
MKCSAYLVLSLLAVQIFFSGCQKSVDDSMITTGPEISDVKGKILYQFSFENNNYDTSLQGWKSPNYSFSKDVPPGGGVWSLQLTPGWIPQQGYAEHSVKLDSGNYQLKFKSETRVVNNSTNALGGGYIRLIKRSISATNTTKDNILAEKQFTNTTWKIHAVLSPVHIGAGDLIVIQVSAGATELVTWSTLFDNVMLLSQ